MIQYNPKDWITFIFRFHQSDTFRKLLSMMFLIGLYSFFIGYLEIEIWKLSENSHVKNITIMHQMLGFVISLLLVFRTNTAYDRWWEGRKQWGTLVNCSRNLSLKLQVILKEESDRMFFSKVIPMYASYLNKHLKKENTATILFEDNEIQLNDYQHQPNQIALILHQKIYQLHEKGAINGEQLIILNHELRNFTEICGACERIKNTPIPFSYSAFIKKFIFFYIMTLPFGYVFSLGYYVIPVVVFIFYVLASLELIAEEIEDPFGNDANDLPTDKLTEIIQANCKEILT